MKTVVYLSDGKSYVIDGHPDEFIERFTTDDHSTIIKDLIMFNPYKEDRPVVINTRQITRIEYKGQAEIEFLK